jgi:eukaryotic-like serine/threonine-protein kinase
MVEDSIPDISLRSFLGSGGFGEVWRGEHAPTNAPVAVKLLYPGVSPDAFARMTADVAATSRIAWPGIARLWSSGLSLRGRPYIVYELVDGAPIWKHAGGRSASAVEVADVVYQTSIGLEVAARFGAHHGHLSASNLLVVPASSAGMRIVITDLGSRRLVEAAPTLTSPMYLAPEQFVGSEVDARADVYALGCIAFELACGRPPFVATSWQQAHALHAEAPVPEARTLAPELSVAFDRLLLNMLAKDPGRRPTLAEVTKRSDMILGSEAPLATTRKAPAVK